MDTQRLPLVLQDLRQLHEQLLAATRQVLSLADQTRQATEHTLDRFLRPLWDDPPG